jgi:hypothetical protein
MYRGFLKGFEMAFVYRAGCLPYFLMKPSLTFCDSRFFPEREMSFYKHYYRFSLIFYLLFDKKL